MNNNNAKKIIIAVVAVFIVIAIIGGATFAYWQWVTDTSQRTLVNVTVEQGISMTINPTSVSLDVDAAGNIGMRPTNDCTKANRVFSSTALVTVVNDTGIAARPKFMLKVKITKSDGSDITNAYREYIHYAVGEVNEDLPEEGDNYTVCTSPIAAGTFSGTGNDGQANGKTTNSAGAVIGGWYNSSYITLDTTAADGFPDLTSDNANSVSFTAAAKTTTTHTYKVWGWIGSEYGATNTGNSVTDPLQNATIEISWSDNSEVIQVTS